MDSNFNKFIKFKNIIFVGVGKSYYLGQLFASSCKSIGKNASVLSVNNFFHGDAAPYLDNRDSCFVFISNSGGTTELNQLADYCVGLNSNAFVFTSRRHSELTKICKNIIYFEDNIEGNDLMLPALSICRCVHKFYQEFNRLLLKVKHVDTRRIYMGHPRGHIGRSNVTVDTIMVSDYKKYCVQIKNISLDLVFKNIAENKSGITYLCDGKTLLNAISDGDIRRNFLNNNILEKFLSKRLLITVSPKDTLQNVWELMLDKNLRLIPITEKSTACGQNKLLGFARLQDIEKLI